MGKATYRIRVLAQPDDVDTPPTLREQQMTLYVSEAPASLEEYISIPYTSVAQAKRICLRHVLTGDTAETRGIEETYDAEESEYQKQVAVALSKLNPVCRKHDPPRLPWQSKQLFPIEYTFTGTRREYQVHFEPERRWVVRFMEQVTCLCAVCLRRASSALA